MAKVEAIEMSNKSTNVKKTKWNLRGEEEEIEKKNTKKKRHGNTTIEKDIQSDEELHQQHPNSFVVVHERPSSHLVWSVLSTLCCLFSCPT